MSDSEYDDYPPSKKRKTSINEFIDAEAIHEDVEDEEDIEEHDDGFIQDDEEITDDATVIREINAQLRRKESLGTKVQRSEKFIARLEDKYLRNDYRDYEYEEERDFGHGVSEKGIRQQRQYPTVLDPKLFLVRCKHGKEREAVLTLMQKYWDCEREGNALQIKSAISLDGLKGYIYVEAMKEAHVKLAIRDISLLSEYKMRLVPIKEMTDVLSVGRKELDIKRNSWVRVKRGAYKGDLAQVWYVDEARGTATIKLVPRLDGRKRLFNEQEITQQGGVVQMKRDSRSGEKFAIYKGMKFKGGYLYKAVNFTSLETKNVTPTLDELQQFHQKTGEPGETGLPTNFAIERQAVFKKGDIVKVIEGELKGLMGVVHSVEVDSDTVTVLPKHEKLKDPLQLPSNQLQKHFNSGAFCKVIAGRHKGMTGYIVKIDRDTVSLYSDTLVKEVTVFIQDIEETSEIASSETTIGNYSLHDLVRLDAQNAGVIVKMEKDVFHILDINGNVKTVKLQEMGRKINTKLNNYKTFDRSDNMIGPEDSVKVVDGTYRGREGTVKHVFRTFVFIHARDMMENSGMFVVKGKQCEVSGGRLRSTNQIQRLPRSFSFAKRGRKHHLTDKVVRITKGMYKGYLGNVKDANDMTARVELHSHFKTITVETRFLQEVRPESRQNNVTPRSQISTPWSRQFRDGSETPYHDGARTPYHDGGRTPMHDRGSETPNPNDVWNPNVATPRPWQEESQVPTTPQTTVRTPFSPAVPSFTHSVQTPLVQTPATFTTPSIQTPHTPGPIYTTPGITTPMIGVPQTPGVPMMQTPHTPGPITPEIPRTPGVPITPAPLTPGVRDTEEEIWVSPGIEVEILEEPYTGLKGVIRSVNYTLCTILVKQNEEEKVVDVEQSKLQPTNPNKGDTVRVIKGKDKGFEGRLAGIDTTDGTGLVKGNEIGVYPLDLIAKIVK